MLKPVWTLMAAIGVIGSNSLALGPIAADVAASFENVTATDVLVASALYGGGTAFSAVFIAPRADRYGLGRSLFFATAVLTASLALSALATSINLLIASQALAGLAAGVALPSIYGLSADIAPRGRESETLGKILTGWTISMVFGVSMAAIISDFAHWRVIFAGLSLICLALLVAVAPLSQVATRQSGEGVPSPLKALRIPGVALMLVFVALYMAAFYGLYAFLGAHFVHQLGLSTVFAGIAALSYGIGFGVIAPLDRLIDRFGSLFVSPYAFGLLMLIYLALAASAASVIAILALCLLWGAANHFALNLLVGQLTAISPTNRGTILGLYSAVTYGSMFAGTLAFSLVYEWGGFVANAAGSALCILPVLVMARVQLAAARRAERA